MELYKELLVQILSHGEVHVTFPDLAITSAEIIEIQSYRALQRIKDIIHDPHLSDPECFAKIEAIVCEFESLGSNGGFRHDFG